MRSYAYGISIHALREEGDPCTPSEQFRRIPFLSTPSARRATGCCHAAGCRGRISIHALREEGDAKVTISSCWGRIFLSTPSARRATLELLNPAVVHLEISIHALREEGDAVAGDLRAGEVISIHALREEGDMLSGSATRATSNFYPRPPRGGRHAVVAKSVSAVLFLSTPSARRATWWRAAFSPRKSNFYPRPPRGGRRWGRPARGSCLEFLSTPSARRATSC